MTSPFSTATPDSAMNPTAAETENGMPRSHSASDAAGQRERNRAEHEQRIARRAERAVEQQEDQDEAGRHHDVSRWRAAIRFSNCPPQVIQ